MKQGKLDFTDERITPAKGSIYPFSKHSTDWAFIAFLERVCDRWDAEDKPQEQEKEEQENGQEEALIQAMLKEQEERLNQLAQKAPQAILSSGVVIRDREEEERPTEAYTWKHNKPYRR